MAKKKSIPLADMPLPERLDWLADSLAGEPEISCNVRYWATEVDTLLKQRDELRAAANELSLSAVQERFEDGDLTGGYTVSASALAKLRSALSSPTTGEYIVGGCPPNCPCCETDRLTKRTPSAGKDGEG